MPYAAPLPAFSEQPPAMRARRARRGLIASLERIYEGSVPRLATKEEDLVVAYQAAVFRRDRGAALHYLRRIEPGRDLPVEHVVQLARLLRDWREVVQFVSALRPALRASLVAGLLATGSLRRRLRPVAFALLAFVEEGGAKAPHSFSSVVVSSELDEAFLELAKGEGLRRTTPDLAQAVRAYFRSALARSAAVMPARILQAEENARR